MLKIAMVSSIRPETNYTAYLIEVLQNNYQKDCEILVYTDKDKRNLEVPLSNLKLVWHRDWPFIFQILFQAFRDKVDVVHLQHEINMFGGPRTAALFPFGVFLLRFFGFRPVVTVHAVVPTSSLNEEFLKVFEWPKPHLLAPLVKIIFPTIYFLIGLFSQKIIVHSPGLKEILSKDYKVSKNKITVVPHGVPEDISYQMSDVSGWLLEKLADKRFLLFFGYLHRRKGLEVLIKSFKSISQKYPELKLVLVGGTILPNYSAELESLVANLELNEKVVVTGFVGLNDLRYLLDKCEFVVLPAIYSIAASGPLAQVFAHEKAVIVSDLGVYREEINNGVNGLLSKVNDVPDLTEQIVELLEQPDLRVKISRNVKIIKEDRLWSKVAGQTLAVYKSLI